MTKLLAAFRIIMYVSGIPAESFKKCGWEPIAVIATKLQRAKREALRATQLAFLEHVLRQCKS